MLSWFVRGLSSITFLFSIVFTIPLAFDIYGRECGLYYSLSLAAFYVFYSALRLATPDSSRFRYSLVQLLAALQWLIVPALFIWSLNKYSADIHSGPSKSSAAEWVERTFNRKRAGDETVQAWLFGSRGLVESVSIGTWDKLLRWSVPVFQLGEGFCSLLVIQAAGQMTRWAVNRSSGDNWMVSPCALRVLAARLTSASDWPPSPLSLRHFNLGLLPVPYHDVSGDWNRGCYTHRCRYYVCYIPVCLGHRQW